VIADVLLDPGAQPVIGHRGASGSAPENTIAAFDLALREGAEALEFDVRLTGDGIPIVIHDATLDRTTDQIGPVATRSLTDLMAADAGFRFATDGEPFGFRGQGIRIPTLRQVLERYPEVPLLIEAKVTAAQAPIRAELVRAGAEGRAVVASFLHGALSAFREPPFLAGASRADIVGLVARSWIGAGAPRGRWPACYAVPYRYQNRIEVPTVRFIRSAQAGGKPVHVWTVNTAELARTLWDRGINGIITNYPAILRAERDRRP